MDELHACRGDSQLGRKSKCRFSLSSMKILKSQNFYFSSSVGQSRQPTRGITLWNWKNWRFECNAFDVAGSWCDIQCKRNSYKVFVSAQSSAFVVEPFLMFFNPFISLLLLLGRRDWDGRLQKHVSWLQSKALPHLNFRYFSFLVLGLTQKTPLHAIPTQQSIWTFLVIPREHLFSGIKRKMLDFRMPIEPGYPSIPITLIWIYKRKNLQLKAISSSIDG